MESALTKRERMLPELVLLDFVENHLTAGNFWDDPAYAKEAEAARLMRKGLGHIKRERPTKKLLSGVPAKKHKCYWIGTCPACGLGNHVYQSPEDHFVPTTCCRHFKEFTHDEIGDVILWFDETKEA